MGLGESFWGAEAVEAYLHSTAAPILAGLADVTPATAGVALRPYVGYDGSGAETRGIGAAGHRAVGPAGPGDRACP